MHTYKNIYVAVVEGPWSYIVFTKMLLKEISANLPLQGKTRKRVMCLVSKGELKVKLGRRLLKVSVCGRSIRCVF